VAVESVTTVADCFTGVTAAVFLGAGAADGDAIVSTTSFFFFDLRSRFGAAGEDDAPV
jgi:hypothetical protein